MTMKRKERDSKNEKYFNFLKMDKNKWTKSDSQKHSY